MKTSARPESVRPSSIRISAGALAAWLIYLAVDFWGHAVLLSNYWKETSAYWRPEGELFRLVPVGYLSFAIYCVALAWLLVRLYGDRVGLAAGLRFGAIAGFVSGAAIWLGVYSAMRMPLSAVALFTLWGTVESALAGTAAGSVLASERPWRRAGWLAGLAVALIIAGVLAQNIFFPQAAAQK